MYTNFKVKSKIFLTALGVGLLSGGVGLLFRYLLKAGFTFISSHDAYILFYTFLPLTMFVVVASIRRFGLQEDNQGFGVSQVMYEIEFIKTRLMSPTSVALKTFGTFITLLSGFTVGIHGPITHLGGAIGSNLAFRFKMSEDDTRVLIGCGVAGCMAAAFKAPIFATLFVVEVIFKKRYFDMMGTILLASISGYFITRFFDSEPLMHVASLQTKIDLTYIPHFVLLGLAMGLVACLYVKSIQLCNKIFNRLFKSIYFKAAIGSLVYVLIYSLIDKNFTYGIQLQDLISRDYSVTFWLVIALGFIGLTSITLASGGLGGLFAPGLYIGFSFGMVVSYFHPLGYSSPMVLGYVCMAAMFSGFALAPLTAAFMIVEFTGQYQLALPTLIACLAASTLSEILIKESIYHINLNRLIANSMLSFKSKNL